MEVYYWVNVDLSRRGRGGGEEGETKLLYD